MRGEETPHNPLIQTPTPEIAYFAISTAADEETSQCAGDIHDRWPEMEMEEELREAPRPCWAWE
jgi:hypothetical protein